MMLEEPLACVTAMAAATLFFVVAGPGSDRPFTERLLLWFMTITLIGASLYRIVNHYFPAVGDQAQVVGYVIMFASRLGILGVSLFLVVRWTIRCFPPQIRTPAEVVGDLVAGHRR